MRALVSNTFWFKLKSTLVDCHRKNPPEWTMCCLSLCLSLLAAVSRAVFLHDAGDMWLCWTLYDVSLEEIVWYWKYFDMTSQQNCSNCPKMNQHHNEHIQPVWLVLSVILRSAVTSLHPQQTQSVPSWGGVALNQHSWTPLCRCVTAAELPTCGLFWCLLDNTLDGEGCPVLPAAFGEKSW